MSEEGILKKIDDIWNYCEEIDNHLPKEEKTGYKMLPDILYIRKEVHYLQQKVEQLENIRKEAIKYNKELAELYDIGSMERSNADTNLLILKDEETLNILNKGE